MASAPATVAAAAVSSSYGDITLDLPIEPASQYQAMPDLPTLPEMHSGAMAADLGVPLEFGNVSVPTYPPSMHDDITRPGSEDRQAASGDPHLIDFDMFDVALPPIDKTPPKS